MERLPHTFIQITQRLLVLALATSLSSCDLLSGRAAVDIDDYTTKHSHIRTLGYGSRIYWLNDETLLMRAKILRRDQVVDDGIFQIHATGTYKKLIDLSNDKDTEYCLEDRTLFVFGKKGTSEIVATSDFIDIKVRVNEPKRKGYIRSRFRCGNVHQVYDDFVYSRVLRKGDGYLFYRPKEGVLSNGEIRKVPVWPGSESTKKYWTYDWMRKVGKKRAVWDVKVGRTFLSSVNLKNASYWEPKADSFSMFENAYFGYHETHTDCVKTFWIYRADWSVKYGEACVDNSAAGGSRVLTSSKAGVVFNRHSGGLRKGLYLVKDGVSTFLKSQDYRNETVSPSGCLVATSVGDTAFYLGKDTSTQQELQIIDLCAYSSDKKSRSDALQAKT